MNTSERIDDLHRRLLRVEARMEGPMPRWPVEPEERYRTLMHLVAGRFGFSVYDLTCHDRHEHLAWARQVAMALCYDLLHMSNREIGLAFERDRTTVIAAIRAVKARCETDPKARCQVLELRHQLTDSLTH